MNQVFIAIMPTQPSSGGRSDAVNEVNGGSTRVTAAPQDTITGTDPFSPLHENVNHARPSHRGFNVNDCDALA